MAGGPAGEELWGHKQFGFAEHGELDSPADLGGVGGGGAGQRDRGVERALQGVVTDVADEYRPTGGQQIQGGVGDLGQVIPVGEVLDDRVENDRVEIAPRQCLGDVSRLGQQLDSVTPRELPLLERVREIVDRHRRHVGGDIVLTVRGELRQHQPGADTDLQHSARLQGEDPIHGGRTPLHHLLERNRIIGIAAVPAPEIHAEPRRRHLGVVQLVVHVPPLFDDLGVGGGGVVEDDVGDEVGAVRAPVHGRGGPADVRAGQQRVLDLAQFDPLSAQLDLSVGAAQIIQGSGGGPAHQVAGAIHPRPGLSIGIGHEPFRGQLHPAHIAARQHGPAQIQLAHHSDRGRVQPRVEDQRAYPRHRDADADRLPGRQRREGGTDGGLAGAVAVEHPPSRRPDGHQLPRAGLTGGDHRAHPVEPGRIQRRQHGRGQHRRADPLVLQERGQRLPGIHLRRCHHQRRGRPDRPQHVEDRRIEGRCGHHRNPRIRVQSEHRPLRRGQAQQPGVTDRHPLGDTGRSRGEHHIRGVVHSQPGPPIGVGDRLRGPLGHIPSVDAHDRTRRGTGHRVRPASDHAYRPHRVQHRGDPLDRVGLVQWHIHSAGFGHRPPRHDQLHAAIHRHAHRALRTHARLDQYPRQPRRPLVELAIRHLPGAVDDRRRVRAGRHRRGQQLRRQPDRRCHSRTGPLRQHQIAFTGSQQRDRSHRHRRIRHQKAVEQHFQPGYVPGDVVGVVSIRIPRELNSRRAVTQPRINVDCAILYGIGGQYVVGHFGRPELKRGGEVENVDRRAEFDVHIGPGRLGDQVRPAPELLMPQRTDHGLGHPIAQYTDGVVVMDIDEQRHHVRHHARTSFQRRGRPCRNRQ
ncbi:hypothetical protein B7C42_06214 [Nocardia cerradoensis]|uniref:Uncharacterized protein n=1 Tax=Nocardia cerradoensis TaxID=85688 RepID=A0A231GY68_9NOCA|nr:hypothetical protein B7C42_06214 [Nocardia cerradoensis]